VTIRGPFAKICSMSQTEKILIIRFSSFGDVVQSLSLPSALKQGFPEAEVHWVTRSDMAPLLRGHPHLDCVWIFSRADGIVGLIQLAMEIRKQNFTRIYDAHNNLRSHLLSFILRPFGILGLGPQLLRRSIRRWKRFLLFRFRVNTFEKPFSGQRDLLEPLQAWGISKTPPPAPQIFVAEADQKKARELAGDFAGAIALAPSAAYFLKRWPQDHWIELIQKMPSQKFILLGGPQDTFIEDIVRTAPDRTLNLAGKTSLGESAGIVEMSCLLIANDTGLLHVGEQLGKNCIALMGPAPFGFPSRATTKIMEIDLPCRPCSKHGQGPCVNKKFHRCMVDITPAQIAVEAQRKISR
jgi:ADP-heptose:LPS heptosyltransferase